MSTTLPFSMWCIPPSAVWRIPFRRGVCCVCVYVCVRTCLYMHLHACTARVFPMKQFSIGIIDLAYEFMFKSNCPYLNGAVYNCVTGRDRSS